MLLMLFFRKNAVDANAVCGDVDVVDVAVDVDVVVDVVLLIKMLLFVMV